MEYICPSPPSKTDLPGRSLYCVMPSLWCQKHSTSSHHRKEKVSSQAALAHLSPATVFYSGLFSDCSPKDASLQTAQDLQPWVSCLPTFAISLIRNALSSLLSLSEHTHSSDPLELRVLQKDTLPHSGRQGWPLLAFHGSCWHHFAGDD